MFTPQEKKTILGINFAVVARMLGLFLLLPVLSPYVKDLQGGTPLLTGLAVGIYGFTQSLLQIPFGYISDRIGRKPVITFGFILYILGSLAGGLATTAWSMILARLLQGAGAISSSALSLTADLIREEVRTRAFAQIGASVGITFAVSIIVAPILAGNFGVPFIFFITAFFSTLAMLYILFFIKEPNKHHREIEPSIKNLSLILSDSRISFINLSVALLHALLVTVFTVVPIELIENIGIQKGDHWKVYVPVIFLSIAIMVPAIIFAEKRGKIREVMASGVLIIALGFAAPLLINSSAGIFLMLALFFVGFHLLEPVLPSLLTRITHRDLRGLSVGLYNTSQFIGAFAGGILGGIALKKGLQTMHIMSLVLSLLWLILVILSFRRFRL